MSTAEKRFKACIFDLDGTLLDTLGDLTAAVNRALEKSGLPSRSKAEVKSFIGNGALMLMSRASGLEPESAACRALRVSFAAEYAAGTFGTTVPYEGICELVADLASRGVKTAVVSNKDDSRTKALINRFFGKNVLLARGTLDESERKPDPAVTLDVIKSIGSAPSETVFIGDGRADFETARNAGLAFIPVGYGYTDPDVLKSLSGVEPVKDVSALYEKLKEFFDPQ